MKINEIFHSIQGESSFAGLPCVFVRLAGCDLRCTYCDTQYAFNEGREMSIPEVLRAVAAFDTRLVLVTGGEPMLQPSVHDLFEQLLEQGYTVLVETGGHRSLADVDRRVHKIVDLKCPSSGMADHNDYGNIQYLTRKDELKFVVGDRQDFDWACDVIGHYDIGAKVGTILVSPVYGKLSYRDLADWVLKCPIPIRLQLQLQKIIWPDINRGV